MKNILVIGAGLSSSSLIKYLLEHANTEDWMIQVGDVNQQLAESKINNHPKGNSLLLNINDGALLEATITKTDLVISLLPPNLHIHVAKLCLKHSKHFISASYVTEEMKNLHVEALKSNILLLNECGLDPGIDHMSAMKMIHKIQSDGGEIVSFKSYCGGLIAKESDNNPWHYKFTWNPRNVVLAGQNTARYLSNGELKFIPPSRIFNEIEQITIPDGEVFDCYANRDSLDYLKPYGIENAKTVMRGTMRGEGFCEAWDCLVKLGLTDDTITLPESHKITFRELTSAFTPGNKQINLEERVLDFLKIEPDDSIFLKLKWLGIFNPIPILIPGATPAMILQNLLLEKWKLFPGDIDRIIMHHAFVYKNQKLDGYNTSTLVVKGENNTLTAMAKTVGLPMGIAAKLLLQDKIKTRGVQIPTTAEFYNPILKELALYGIEFEERTSLEQ